MGAVLDPAQHTLMKDEYYHLRGWDTATGAPPGEKLRQLGLADVAEELQRLNPASANSDGRQEQ